MGIAEDKKTTEQIAENIRKVREKKGLTQEEHAKKAGLNSNYYARVERGEAKPSGVTLMKIKRALGVEYSELLPK